METSQNWGLCSPKPFTAADHQAALEYPDDRGVQREALPLPYPFCLWQGGGEAENMPLLVGWEGDND